MVLNLMNQTLLVLPDHCIDPKSELRIILSGTRIALVHDVEKTENINFDHEIMDKIHA